MAASDSGNVWAVGGTFSSTKAEALVLRFDGKRWKKQPLPRVEGRARLNAVATAPDGTVWAVGEIRTPDGTESGLALRWDGRSWKRIALPDRTVSIEKATFGKGEVVLLAQTAGAGPAALRRAGDTWVSLGLPTTVKGRPLSPFDISGHGDTIDVTGVLPGEPPGSTGPGIVLTARR
ncbi:hypothetical protein ABZ714_23155 [Streptomyces sp. NPDC006798]|uniref:hypothetical protein n=1 Tax=Streptomyces sp. NPDC006798 TaxID=3155462 RepID=UPI0033CDF7C4